MRVCTNVLFGAVLAMSAASAERPETKSDTPSEIRALDGCAAQTQNNSQHDAAAQEVVEVWIDLSEPALSTQSREDGDAREALRARITRQQDETIERLGALGATEISRVSQVRNAIAVRMPSASLAQARALPGVVKVRPVKHRKRSSQCSSRN